MRRFTVVVASVLFTAIARPAPVMADTIAATLARASLNNQQLNVERAQLAATPPRPLENDHPPNQTPAPESQVSGAREALRSLDQSVLLQAATIYMDYLLDAVIVEVQKNNVRALEQTLKQTRDRFDASEVAHTDVAQTEASLAAGKAQQLTAEANLAAARTTFRLFIGSEPRNLAPASPVDRLLPRTLRAAIELGLMENPNVTAAMHGIDISYLQVKVAEGVLMPPSLRTTAPEHQEGREYSIIRQSKEPIAQQRLNLEMIRNQTRANLVQAWGQLEASKTLVTSAQAHVTECEITLNDVRAKSNQRTTREELNARQRLVNARVALVTAQHDRVVASYSALNAVGRMSSQAEHVPATTYDPSIHRVPPTIYDLSLHGPRLIGDFYPDKIFH